MSIKSSSRGAGFAKVLADLQRVKRSEVLVGIPAEKSSRKKGPVNNAELLFIHTEGSPLRSIPPRPTLKPAIEENAALIAEPLGDAATALMEDSAQRAETSLKRAGIVASNAVKRYIREEDHLAPNSPETIARKGSDRPLIDTGQLVRAITYVVRVK